METRIDIAPSSRDVNFICEWRFSRELPRLGIRRWRIFPVGMGMKEKVPPREVWGWGRDFIPRPAETPSPKTLL
ncbi:hypothetical protein A2U01_0073607, partial [Trifolium medium]|nr:hypothetical protein [Trifolium medium]